MYLTSADLHSDDFMPEFYNDKVNHISTLMKQFNDSQLREELWYESHLDIMYIFGFTSERLSKVNGVETNVRGTLPMFA